MIYGIVDVGSNTIRLSIYKYENNKVVLLLNKKTMAGLAGYVKDGELSKAGIKRACEVLKAYKEIVENFQIKNVFVFATASLRNVSNTDEAVLRIKEETGFNTEIILGENEAIYDFIGASQVVDISDGILIDIGGGSTELVMYKNKEIVNLLHEYRSISMEEYDSSYNDILNYLKNDGEISSNTMSKSEEILKQLDSLLCLFVNNH